MSESSNRPDIGFPETLWSRVASASRGSADALDLLCRWYRPVILKLVEWTLPPGRLRSTEAEDVTQEFFVYLLEHREEILGKADPSRGKFRAWLRTCLKNWLHNWRDRMGARKRLGERADILMEWQDVEGDSLEREFDQQWARDVLSRVDEKLKVDAAAGRLQADDLDIWSLKVASQEMSEREIAVQLHLTENEVHVAVRRVRRLYEEHLRAGVLPTVASKENLEEELAELRRCSALGGGSRAIP